MMSEADDSAGPKRPRAGRRSQSTRQAQVTTRTGDDGYTQLLGKERVPKWHARPDAFGTLDEATSALGLARALTAHAEIGEAILALQKELYLLMAELATGPDEYERSPFRITAEHVAGLEERTEAVKSKVKIGRA